jgi:hypothetical protein
MGKHDRPRDRDDHRQSDWARELGTVDADYDGRHRRPEDQLNEVDTR